MNKLKEMKYNEGDLICISVCMLARCRASMKYVNVRTKKDEFGTFYMLYNEHNELCCLDGEECMIVHLIERTENIYDLRNNNGENPVHFLLSSYDLDIATFKN